MRYRYSLASYLFTLVVRLDTDMLFGVRCALVGASAQLYVVVFGHVQLRLLLNFWMRQKFC